jgi:hypothetical protein|tara:strand:+ start:4370 stop:5632 length:1263 start_codon:yes stop_codon:yes gene_type:complete
LIELKDLNPWERYQAIRGCETFFLTYRSPNWQKRIVEKLKEEFGEKYEIPIKVILTAAAKARRYNDKGCMFPLNANEYSSTSAIMQNTGKKISYRNTRKLLDLMESAGYITILKGYFCSKDNSMPSYLVFQDKLLKLLDKNVCKKYAINRFEGLVVVEIVDEELSTKNRKVFKTNSKFKGVAEITKEVKLVNKVISEAKITFEGEVCTVVYKRRFHNDTKSGGRWYVIGSFQTEDSEKRYTIEIDDEACTEVDFKFIHPSIFATLEGITLSEDYDPYDIKHLLNTSLSKKDVRTFCKVAMMALLYSENRGTALHEIRKNIRNDKSIDFNEKDVLEALEEHNYFLHKYFYHKDNWKLAQYIDSQIATKVMLHFANKGEVCLCYHDSFIVKRNFREELIAVMKDSWNSVLGNTNNFKYDVEF